MPTNFSSSKNDNEFTIVIDCTDLLVDEFVSILTYTFIQVIVFHLFEWHFFSFVGTEIATTLTVMAFIKNKNCHSAHTHTRQSFTLQLKKLCFSWIHDYIKYRKVIYATFIKQHINHSASNQLKVVRVYVYIDGLKYGLCNLISPKQNNTRKKMMITMIISSNVSII